MTLQQHNSQHCSHRPPRSRSRRGTSPRQGSAGRVPCRFEGRRRRLPAASGGGAADPPSAAAAAEGRGGDARVSGENGSAINTHTHTAETVGSRHCRFLLPPPLRRSPLTPLSAQRPPLHTASALSFNHTRGRAVSSRRFSRRKPWQRPAAPPPARLARPLGCRRTVPGPLQRCACVQRPSTETAEAGALCWHGPSAPLFFFTSLSSPFFSSCLSAFSPSRHALHTICFVPDTCALYLARLPSPGSWVEETHAAALARRRFSLLLRSLSPLSSLWPKRRPHPRPRQLALCPTRPLPPVLTENVRQDNAGQGNTRLVFFFFSARAARH